MAEDTSLSGALAALKLKITSISSGANTTAEDLAMLGVAIEKIAGQVSAVELDALAALMKASISDLTDAKKAEITTARNTAVTAIENAKSALSDLVTKLTSDATTSGVNQINTARDNGLTAFNNAKNGILDLGNARIFTGTFNAATITRNANGLVSGFTSGNGVTYSNIVYDGQLRLTNWTETANLGTQGVKSYRFTATYDLAGNIAEVKSVAL